MRVIIAGTRDLPITLSDIVSAIEESRFHITAIISGHSGIVDKLGEEWAALNRVPIHQYLPQWAVYGKSAGPRRNEEMAKNAEALILLWDGFSKGSRSMLLFANRYELMIYEKVICRQEGEV